MKKCITYIKTRGPTV